MKRMSKEDREKQAEIALLCTCDECERPYGDEHGFPDLILPQWAWNEISPTGNESGLLCPCCIIKRLVAKGIRCEASIASTAIDCVPLTVMQTIRRLDNLEAAVEGRKNRWGAALDERISEALAARTEFGEFRPRTHSPDNPIAPEDKR